MSQSQYPHLDACARGTWADWMLAVIGQQAREDALAALLRPENVVSVK